MELDELLAREGLDAAKLQDTLAWARQRADQLLVGLDHDPELSPLLSGIAHDSSAPSDQSTLAPSTPVSSERLAEAGPSVESGSADLDDPLADLDFDQLPGVGDDEPYRSGSSEYPVTTVGQRPVADDETQLTSNSTLATHEDAPGGGEASGLDVGGVGPSPVDESERIHRSLESEDDRPTEGSISIMSSEGDARLTEIVSDVTEPLARSMESTPEDEEPIEELEEIEELDADDLELLEDDDDEQNDGVPEWKVALASAQIDIRVDPDADAGDSSSEAGSPRYEDSGPPTPAK